MKAFLFMLALSLCLFLLLSLITYHATDPSWSNTGQTQEVSNLGGRVGAWLADIFLYICGYLAFVFPFLFSYCVWQYAYSKHDAEEARYLLHLKVMGFLLFLFAGTGIASLHFLSNAHLPFTAGGVLGNVVGYSMVKIFNPAGSGLMLFAIFITGLTLITGCSWLVLADHIGKFVLDKMNGLKSMLQAKKLQLRREPKIKKIHSSEKKADKPAIIRVEPKVKYREPEQDKKEPAISSQINNESPKKTTRHMAPVTYEPSLEGTIPPIALLDLPDRTSNKGYSNQQLEHMSREVELRLQDFGIDVKVVAVHPGPVVTRFELQLAAGTKVSRISALAKDLARSLSVISVRIVEIIPGKPVIGLELPNQHREIVRLREVLASTAI